VTGKAERDRLRVTAMIEAIEEARRDAAGGRSSFVSPGLVQKAVLLDLIHLTESAEKASPGLKKGNPGVPWARLSRLRNRGLVHDYAEVDLEEIWAFVREELPRIRTQLQRLRFEGGNDSPSP
jgi:uncharacterized protein with HEPN domain